MKRNKNIKDKIISKSHKVNKNFILNKLNNRSLSIFNISPKDQKSQHKFNYINTDIGHLKNNINSNINKNEKSKASSNIVNLNKVKIESPNIKEVTNSFMKNKDNNLNKFRIYSANILKKKKNYFFSENNNKKETQIYLNNYVDKFISESNKQRISSTRGFIRKADFDTDIILNNKKKNKNNNFNKKNCRHVNSLNLNFHKNNYKYEYIKTEKNENKNKNDVYHDLFLKYRLLKNKQIQTNLKPNDEKENYLLSIINNITRKVQFLNTKNDLLSNENTMNLLNKEEFLLYKKLKEYFNDIYSIKKFSKSIFNAKNGNKYLLPLFNDINFHSYNKADDIKSNEEKTESNIKDYNNEIFENYKIKKSDFIHLFLNNEKIKNQLNKHKLTNIYIGNIDTEAPSQGELSIGKTNEKKNEFQKINTNINKKVIYLKNSKRNELIDSDYQQFKLKLIKENEDIINNYYKKKYRSTKERLYRKSQDKCFSYRNIIPINDNKIINENNESKEEIKPIYKKRLRKDLENVTSREENIKEDNANINIINNQNNEKKRNINKFNQRLIINNNRKNKKIHEENKNEKKNQFAHLSTKNFDNNRYAKKINQTANNDDIKNFLNNGNNFNSKLLTSNLSNKNISRNNDNNTLIKDMTKNSKTEEKKTIIKKNNSKTIEIKKKESNIINNDLNNITISNNIVLKESLRMEDNKLIAKIEKKKNKILKLLYSYIKNHLKGIFEKNKIKELLSDSEFSKNFELLKSQMNQIKKLSNSNQNEGKHNSQLLTDDDIIEYLYDEFNIKSQKKEVIASPKSTYVASLRLKKKNKTIKKEEKKGDDEKAKNEYLEKENEKMEVMATEMHLSNELKHHIRETYNNEFKKRFQKILEKIESYQELGVAEYIETFKSNYGALKEEMAQILRDKEMEERLNIFMSNLDSERNIFETKYNFCKNKINVIDSKFQTSMGKYEKINIKKYK